FESDAVDHLRLDHRHDDLAASAPDLHILEQAGIDQGLVGIVDLEVVEALTRAQPEIGLDRARFDAPVALDDDLLRGSGFRHGNRPCQGANKHPAQDERRNNHPAYNAGPELHAQRALVLLPSPTRDGANSDRRFPVFIIQFRGGWEPRRPAHYSFTLKALP